MSIVSAANRDLHLTAADCPTTNAEESSLPKDSALFGKTLCVERRPEGPVEEEDVLRKRGGLGEEEVRKGEKEGQQQPAKSSFQSALPFFASFSTASSSSSFPSSSLTSSVVASTPLLLANQLPPHHNDLIVTESSTSTSSSTVSGVVVPLVYDTHLTDSSIGATSSSFVNNAISTAVPAPLSPLSSSSSSSSFEQLEGNDSDDDYASLMKRFVIDEHASNFPGSHTLAANSIQDAGRQDSFLPLLKFELESERPLDPTDDSFEGLLRRFKIDPYSTNLYPTTAGRRLSVSSQAASPFPYSPSFSSMMSPSPFGLRARSRSRSVSRSRADNSPSVSVHSTVTPLLRRRVRNAAKISRPRVFNKKQRRHDQASSSRQNPSSPKKKPLPPKLPIVQFAPEVAAKLSSSPGKGKKSHFRRRRQFRSNLASAAKKLQFSDPVSASLMATTSH